ncbi:hypothetical protein HJC23_010704 [Cyclotella cryptica]|uniref:Histone deacetylase interacting domain-containing protein n=1 Tax=Cyclotella cryptica TaxID=29204 RepID=A0ABD3PDD8_9STRA|eukprot:CCRYP_015433-RA/>CCRYP_015433-RA protein AED:0.07 eAED:0.07 QI:458/1/1/1/0.8/0.66/6/417/1526
MSSSSSSSIPPSSSSSSGQMAGAPIPPTSGNAAPTSSPSAPPPAAGQLVPQPAAAAVVPSPTSQLPLPLVLSAAKITATPRPNDAGNNGNGIPNNGPLKPVPKATSLPPAALPPQASAAAMMRLPADPAAAPRLNVNAPAASSDKASPLQPLPRVLPPASVLTHPKPPSLSSASSAAVARLGQPPPSAANATVNNGGTARPLFVQQTPQPVKPPTLAPQQPPQPPPLQQQLHAATARQIQPPPPPQPDQAALKMHPSGRELKVEDALLYLDQVKLEFGDRPRIYNEFLEIMKCFKAQEVDTVGVIHRVRSLFRGYNNLILGFNTFLPEGYKIEMRDLEPVFVGPGLPPQGLSGNAPLPPGPQFMQAKPLPGRGGPGGRGTPQPGRGLPMMPSSQASMQPGGPSNIHIMTMPGRGRGGAMQPMPGRGMAGRGPPPNMQKQMQQLPPTQLQPTPPTPQQPNQPTPQQPNQPMSQQPTQSALQQPTQPTLQQPTQPALQQPNLPTQSTLQQPNQPTLQQPNQQLLQQPQPQQPPQQPRQQQTFMGSFPEMGNTQMPDAPPQMAQRAVEFDHAIMYVTNIKKRFASQPRTYHTFLEILHTYQKEQRGIKEVLEQVSSLFADHPDLLREFTFFLPDAVQEQAKERLSRAAAEAEAKQRAAVEAAAKLEAEQLAAGNQKAKNTPTGWRAPKGPTKPHAPHPPPIPGGAQKFIDMTQPGDATHRQERVPGSAGIQKNEVFVYNSGVERQFFDAVKAALFSFSRDGQAYAEFIKTLDMYAQEILSRNDMLGYVERLLGKNRDLFEQFKCIITAIGAPDAPAHDDSWHSVPLSEIDFSRCRRCTPSYRALPRDYPNPPCSERSEEDLKVLNDVWVSLPVGSEESYTFRHMRKNQYEEVLFRCEDMRFEIDMCIDGNASTLQRLSKIYDELQLLSKNEALSKGAISRGGSDGSGLGGKVYQYTLDGRVLSVIHKHTIKRIYGDDGPEMLDLCFRNPAVAIPIIVNRLRQKDKEWRAAKEALNRKWKDLAEFNYYRSLDHRSITWRTTDKRATSTRTLVAEIKDRAAHNGLEGEAALSAKKDKAKEEHGAFYEVTMGCTLPRKMDLTDLPKPTKTLFTPHLSFRYSNNSWSQKDAYRIISFALERGSASPTDKERCYRLWRDFLAPWFGLELCWMQGPAAKFTPSLTPEHPDNAEKDDSSTNDDGGSSHVNNAEKERNIMELGPNVKLPGDHNGYFSTAGHLPFPPGTSVSTTHGEAKVVKYLENEGVYELSCSSGSKRFLPPNAVFCTIFPVESSDLTNQLRANDPEVLERLDDNLMIGTQCLYLFFRLHQILVRRLNIAKDLAEAVSKDTALGRHVEKLSYDGDPKEGKKRYDAFVGLVYSLLDAGGGSSEASEGGKFEDRVRCLLGNQSYELTTMDKLISHILKNLQHMASDDTLQNMIELYQRHKLSGSFKPTAFREEAALLSEGENMYAFQICNIPDEDEKIIHYEFLGCIAEITEEEEEAQDEERENNKRGIDEVMDSSDDVGQASSKRIR